MAAPVLPDKLTERRGNPLEERHPLADSPRRKSRALPYQGVSRRSSIQRHSQFEGRQIHTGRPRAPLQTLDRGAPVSRYALSRELGHGSEEMLRRVYAHLGDVRHRSEVVEFRWNSTSSGWAIGSSGQDL